MQRKLSIYLLDKPVIEEAIARTQFHLTRICPSIPPYCGKSYTVHPNPSEHFLFFIVHEFEDPSVYVYRRDVEIRRDFTEAYHEAVRLAREEGADVPSILSQKFNKDGYRIVADGELYEVLQRNPELEEQLPWFQPLWDIVKLSKGGPIYEVALTTCMVPLLGTPLGERNLETMTEMAYHLATKNNGIVWDNKLRRFSFESSTQLLLPL